jgi:hypothetical protein
MCVPGILFLGRLGADNRWDFSRTTWQCRAGLGFRNSQSRHAWIPEEPQTTVSFSSMTNPIGRHLIRTCRYLRAPASPCKSVKLNTVTSSRGRSCRFESCSAHHAHLVTVQPLTGGSGYLPPRFQPEAATTDRCIDSVHLERWLNLGGVGGGHFSLAVTKRGVVFTLPALGHFSNDCPEPCCQHPNIEDERWGAAHKMAGGSGQSAHPCKRSASFGESSSPGEPG